MIARIESNCTTGEVKYFDENEVEIDPSHVSVSSIDGNEPLPADELQLPVVEESTHVAEEATPNEESNP
jgi:hypothetical protein